MRLRAENISFRYGEHLPWILKDVGLTVEPSERVGITGPSGYGKSTLSKILAGYVKPDEGQVLIDDEPLSDGGFLPVQMIYQHPEQAVNPRWKMERVLNECWHPDESVLRAMGIDKEWLKRRPSELSGGELQRFCIARVLAPETRVLICDEISTMMDVITQAQIWELILNISKERELGLVVITHSMALAEKVCDKVVYLPEINNV